MVTLHSRDSNLSLTPACVTVIVVSVSVLQVFTIPFPQLTTFRRKHPQCNTLCLQAVCGLFRCGENSLLYFTNKMVEHFIQVASEYEERLRMCEYVPRFSYGRRVLRDDGGPNRFFLIYLFYEQSLGIQFLKDIGLLRSKMQCNTCGLDMTWSADSTISEGFRWRCQRRFAGVRCNESASINLGSWFQQSNLTLQECKARRVPPRLQFLHLVANTDWSQCCLPRTDRAT